MTTTEMLSIPQSPKRRRKTSRTTRLFATGIIAALIGGGVAIAQNVPPCINEDGSGQAGACVWDASERGNGNGRDFLAVPDGDDKRIVFLSK